MEIFRNQKVTTTLGISAFDLIQFNLHFKIIRTTTFFPQFHRFNSYLAMTNFVIIEGALSYYRMQIIDTVEASLFLSLFRVQVQEPVDFVFGVVFDG
jgi:hypothetical protein